VGSFTGSCSTHCPLLISSSHLAVDTTAQAHHCQLTAVLGADAAGCSTHSIVEKFSQQLGILYAGDEYFSLLAHR